MKLSEPSNSVLRSDTSFINFSILPLIAEVSTLAHFDGCGIFIA